MRTPILDVRNLTIEFKTESGVVRANYSLPTQRIPIGGAGGAVLEQGEQGK